MRADYGSVWNIIRDYDVLVRADYGSVWNIIRDFNASEGIWCIVYRNYNGKGGEDYDVY